MKKIKTTILQPIAICLLILASCGKKSVENGDTSPDTGQQNATSSEYQFQYNALSQGIDFINNLLILNNNIDKTVIYDKQRDFEQYYNKKITLQEGQVSINDWTATSPDLFATNNPLKNRVRDRFLLKIDELISLREKLISNYIVASQGVAGYIGNTDIPGALRYVDEKGIEISEATEKQIMGIVLLDQILNNHLGNSIMKNEELRTRNKNRVMMEGRKYTELEYHWDIAFALLGTDNREQTVKFIANYLVNEFQGADFLKGIDLRVYEAFKNGREALATADYETVEKNISIIRHEISMLFAARTTHYLKKARANVESTKIEEYHEAFHALSEVHGFIPALIATRKANGEFYITDYSVINNLIKDFEGTNGFWEKERLLADKDTPGSLDNIGTRIAEIYGFDYNKIY